MIFLNKKVLTILLGAAASHHVFGETSDLSASSSSSSDGDECLARHDSPIYGLQEEEDLVTCGSLETSLTDIVKYLSSDDDDFGGAVTFAGDGVSAECLDYQYPLQGPQPQTCTLYDKTRDQFATPNVATTPTRPTYIVQASNEVDAQATILYASICGYKVNTRSGGHSYLGISSCDGSVDCIQLDVKMLNTIEVSDEGEGKQLHVEPGVTLEELAVVFVENGAFVPGGICDDIGIGGHLQTGGIGMWGPLFGAFSNYVDSFKIVLADGSLQAVTKPKDGTTKLNDDLFYAVLGGASGSFGTIVDVTLNTVKEKKYRSFYWEVSFLYNSDTLPGIINMLKKYAELLEDVDVDSIDTKWNLGFTVIGSKAAVSNLISTQTGNPSVGQNLSFNLFKVQLAWAIPKSLANGKKKALAEATAFYNDLVAECSDCVLLDDYIGQFQEPDSNPLKPVGDFLAASFPSDYGVEAPISKLYKELTVFDWDSYPLQGVPYRTSYQQGPSFPNGDALEDILTSIDASMPKTGSLNPVEDGLNEVYFVLAQFIALPGPRFVDSSIALPHQSDVFGVAFDMWDLTRGLSPAGSLLPFIGAALNAVQNEAVIPALGDVNHRMFWAAYETPDLTTASSEDVGKYYESADKYDRLVEIKSCVDPNDVFQSRMSLPVSTA